MREEGFVSNRLFDAAACGACIVSDTALGIEEIFSDTIFTYHTADELKRICEQLLSNPDMRTQYAERLAKVVREKHTFRNRVATILSVVKPLLEQHVNGKSLVELPDRYSQSSSQMSYEIAPSSAQL
jgi:spore maturation protein CgeB